VECVQTMTVKPSTKASYESLLRTRILPEFGDQRLDAIRTMQVQRWVSATAAAVSASRTRQAYHLMSSMLNMAARYGELAKSPCHGIKLPRLPRHETAFLTPEQIREVANRVGHYRPLVLFLAFTGMRWGEATALRVGDIDGNRANIRQAVVEVNGHFIFGTPKNHHRRSVVLPTFLVKEIALPMESARQRSDGLVFTTRFGRQIRASNFRMDHWRPALAKAGLPETVTIHALRHTCAAMLVRQNVPPKAIQRILGHSSIAVTLDVYGHLYESAMDDAADALNALWR
jgi:integrase